MSRGTTCANKGKATYNLLPGTSIDHYKRKSIAKLMRDIKIPYSSFFPTVIITILITLLLWSIKSALQKSLVKYSLMNTWSIFALLLILFFIIFFIYKILISFLNRSSAIILNKKGIIDKTRNILIEWDKIKHIGIEVGKTSSNLIIKMANGRQTTIYLSIVKGNSFQIHEIIQNYFENVKEQIKH